MSSDFKLQRDRVESIISFYSVGCAGVAIFFTPIVGSSAFLTSIEAKMCYDIARVYGFYPTLEESGGIIGGLVAASGVLKVLAKEGAIILPAFGWFVKGGIAFSACNQIGKIAMHHFEAKSNNVKQKINT